MSDINDRFEMLAEQFRKETDVWPPGKSMPQGMYPDEYGIRQRFFDFWMAHRWIPVSEGSPKKTGAYLVLPHIKHCPVLWYQDGWYWFNHQEDAISDTIGYCEEPIPEITHFMALPKGD